MKFMKMETFKPPKKKIAKPLYSIRYFGSFKKYYIYNVALTHSRREGNFLDTAGNRIHSTGSSGKNWIGFFDSYQQAKELLESIGATYE